MKLGKEARQALIDGANKVADAVKVTMGAEGKVVIIESKMGFDDHITKDGVTVAENVWVECSYEERGANAIREAAKRTVDLVGDGTTTCTVITQELINQGFKRLSSDVSHVELREGMKIALEDVKKSLDKLKKIAGDKEIRQIATISANNDSVLGNLIADVYKRVGLEGTIDVQEGVSTETTVNYSEGMTLERGWSLPHFVTEKSTMTAELENVNILIYDGKINSVSDIAGAVRQTQTEGRGLLIFAEDLEEGVMTMLVKAKLSGTLNVSVSINPDFGINRSNILEDLAIYTGGKVTDPKISKEIFLGTASKIISDKDRTVIITETVNPEVYDRVSILQVQLESSEDKSNIQKRISNLRNTVAVITVGGVTPTEVKEKKDRVDDAVSAVKSAIQSGYVAGGGSTLVYISNHRMNRVLTGGYKEGYDLVKLAIRRPFLQILENAGFNNVVAFVDKYGTGINVKDRKSQNLLKRGIIDSAKVLEVALENAVGVSSLILQTDCIIISKGI